MKSKYHLVSDNLKSRTFIVVSEKNGSETCQLLRDLDFSMIVKTNDIINLSICDKQSEKIQFNYIINKNKNEQSFYNNDFKLTFTFIYKNTIDDDTFMIYCPNFTLYDLSYATPL